MSIPSKPEHPLVQDDLHRDTLDRAQQILALMQNLDLSKGLDVKAQLGLFWVHQMVADSMQYVCDSLREESKNKKAKISNGTLG